jgi:predicted 2-oxoglutarate/Fe(II)-dependent dioxygenase YbiX/peroxiredoxin
MSSAVSGPVRAPEFGEPARFFTARTDGVDAYALEVAAGRFIVLMVFGSLGVEACARAHAQCLARRGMFNDHDAAFYGVSVDPDDRLKRGLCNQTPGVRYFWDFNRSVSGLYGLLRGQALQPAIFLIDRSFRILMAEPIEETDRVLDALAAAIAHDPQGAQAPFAPVLTLPNIFEPAFCERLSRYFGSHTAQASGFAADVGGRTVTVMNPALKRRQDVTIEDPDLIGEVESRLRLRLFPMVKRAFNWSATKIERYLISAYGEADHGFFSAHRDDVTAATAHRKFAVSLNLNAEDYEGGDLRFPEFGRRLYRAPSGGATVFCCSLLHEVTPVTRGVRRAFVPFLYDEDGARRRRRAGV